PVPHCRRRPLRVGPRPARSIYRPPTLRARDGGGSRTLANRRAETAGNPGEVVLDARCRARCAADARSAHRRGVAPGSWFQHERDRGASARRRGVSERKSRTSNSPCRRRSIARKRVAAERRARSDEATKEYGGFLDGIAFPSFAGSRISRSTCESILL